jgi:hypothetical protein
MIIIRADTLNARIQFISGFWSNTGDANVDLDATLSVDTTRGRVLGTTAEGSGNAQGDSGQACGGGEPLLWERRQKRL